MERDSVSAQELDGSTPHLQYDRQPIAPEALLDVGCALTVHTDTALAQFAAGVTRGLGQSDVRDDSSQRAIGIGPEPDGHRRKVGRQFATRVHALELGGGTGGVRVSEW